jgi:hypothetical protein
MKRTSAAISLFLSFLLASGPLFAADAFVASKESKKYHRIECELVKRIYKLDKVSYESSAKAEKGGYKPCHVCRPDQLIETTTSGLSNPSPWSKPERPAKTGSSGNMPFAIPPPAPEDPPEPPQEQ